MTSALDITESVKPPRAVFVNFPLGHQTGRPGQPDLQRAIIRDTFRALETITEPGTVVTLPYVWDESDSAWEDGEYRRGYLRPLCVVARVPARLCVPSARPLMANGPEVSSSDPLSPTALCKGGNFTVATEGRRFPSTERKSFCTVVGSHRVAAICSVLTRATGARGNGLSCLPCGSDRDDSRSEPIVRAGAMDKFWSSRVCWHF